MQKRALLLVKEYGRMTKEYKGSETSRAKPMGRLPQLGRA